MLRGDGYELLACDFPVIQISLGPLPGFSYHELVADRVAGPHRNKRREDLVVCVFEAANVLQFSSQLIELSVGVRLAHDEEVAIAP